MKIVSFHDFPSKATRAVRAANSQPKQTALRGEIMKENNFQNMVQNINICNVICTGTNLNIFSEFILFISMSI